MPGEDSSSAEAELDKVSPVACDEEHSRCILDGFGSSRYFMMGSTQTTSDSSSSLFPYPSQSGAVYGGADGSRYYSAVLPAASFCQSPRLSSSYPLGNGPGNAFHSYQGSGPSSGSSLGSIAFSGSGARAQVYLCNRPLWLKFHRHQTEMIITKQGRRMFPFLSFSVSGLSLSAHYHVFVELVLADPNHWRFQGGKWVTCGKADSNMQGNKVYVHPESPNTGAHWMRQEVSFGKLKLTNNKGANTNNSQMIVLQSLHKYQPRLHIVEVSDAGTENTKTQIFNFPENQFIAVTAYQNTDITQLKIDHNPFAKGFRDNYDSMYSLPDRFTPSPSDSPRAPQIIPNPRYSVQPFLQDQFVNNLGPSRLYNSERTIAHSHTIPAEEHTQRWVLTSVPQSNEGEYSSSILPYSFKSLPLQGAHSLGYYPDTFAWTPRGSNPRSITSGLPWSPRPSPTGLMEEDNKEKSREESSFSSVWMESSASDKPSDTDPSVYSLVYKRRRISKDGQDLSVSDDFNKDASSKINSSYAFYPSGS